MSTNYLSVKRRYFANLGIHPNSSPLTFPSRSPSPPQQTYLHTATQSNLSYSTSDSENALQLSNEIYYDGDESSSSSIDSAFDLQLDDIFEFDDDSFPSNKSNPINIPTSLPNSSEINNKIKETFSTSFIPPHLLKSRSNHSSLGEYKYQKARSNAKKAF